MQTYQIEIGQGSTQTDLLSVQKEMMEFGRYRVLPASRLLLCCGEEIPIGGRAFDLLVALLRMRGRLVDKNEIRNSVWPSIAVDESNIRFQIASLRRVLGPEGDLIKTIPGRGYLMADPDFVPDPPLTQLPMMPTSHSEFPTWLKGHYEPNSADEPYVAVVDDDATILDSLAGLIRCAGFRAETFLSTRAFLDSEQANPPICIVLDAWLPGQGGLNFQDKLLSAGAYVPIIFISGHADIAMSVRAIKNGATEFLTKPVRHEDLLNAITTAAVASVPPYIEQYQSL
ncbi:response regulator [Mesorhizobium loti]|nr:response regulator [Mesorhizobium loti]